MVASASISSSDEAAPQVVLEATGLTRHFGSTQAVRGVSFTLTRGEVVGFLGPNGAGKSTTMQMLAGALAPSAGRVTVGGIDLFEEPLAARAQIGYLPEQPPLYKDLSVDEQLQFCCALRNVARSARAAAVADAKARTGLSDSGQRIIGNLSKGFQQRVGIAQALVHKPEVILLDEPTSGLDPNQLRDIRALVIDLSRDHGVMLSTHILGEVRSMCDRVLMMHLGQLVLDTPLAQAAEHQHRYVVRLRDAASAEVRDSLREAPGISSCEWPDERTLHVSLDGNPETLDALVAHVAPFGLRELSGAEDSLEHLFMTLSEAEPPGASTPTESS